MSTQVKQNSFLSRLGNSLLGILIGICLIFFGLYQLAMNEGRSIGQIRAIDDVEKVAIEINPIDVKGENDGKLVILSGTLTDYAPQTDDVYGIKSDSFVLSRKVEMYQYLKKVTGSSTDSEQTITYNAGWYTESIDSSDYPADNQNPPFPSDEAFTSKQKWADSARLGAFDVVQAQLQSLGVTSNIPIPADAILPNRYRIDGNYISSASGTPEVGDIRISFLTNTRKDVTLLGKQSGSHIDDYTTKNGKKFNDLRAGRFTKEELVAQYRSENSATTWMLRFLFAGLVCMGFAMLFKPVEVLTRWIPFLGKYIAGFAKGVAMFISIVLGMVLSLIVIVISWIFVRPLIAVILLVVVAGLIYMIVKMRRRTG